MSAELMSTLERRFTRELASWAATGAAGGIFNEEAAGEAAGGLSTNGPITQRGIQGVLTAKALKYNNRILVTYF